MKLIRLQDSDLRKAYDMYMSFGKGENGFEVTVYGYDFEQFKDWVKTKADWTEGKNLPEGFVPDTTFVLEDDGEYVGAFNLRHQLNDFLSEGPGHIGYCVAKKYRGK